MGTHETQEPIIVGCNKKANVAAQHSSAPQAACLSRRRTPLHSPFLSPLTLLRLAIFMVVAANGWEDSSLPPFQARQTLFQQPLRHAYSTLGSVVIRATAVHREHQVLSLGLPQWQPRHGVRRGKETVLSVYLLTSQNCLPS